MQLWILIALTISALLYFFHPLLDGIIMGIAFAYAAKPIKDKLKSSLLATLIIVVPVFFFLFYGIYTGVSQALHIVTHLEEYKKYFIEVLRNLGDDSVYRYIDTVMVDSITQYIKSKLSQSALELTTSFVLILLNFFISFLVCYYFLIFSDRIFERIGEIFQKKGGSSLETFISEFNKTLTSLWFGNFVFAIMIGLVSLPYFLIFKVPFAPLLSALMFLAALVPVFAEWMVIVPVGVYLILKDVWIGSIFLVFGITFLYVIPELFVRPYFVGKRAKIHPLLILLAFIGGGLTAGLKGFFLAPMLVALFVTIFNSISTKSQL